VAGVGLNGIFRLQETLFYLPISLIFPTRHVEEENATTILQCCTGQEWMSVFMKNPLRKHKQNGHPDKRHMVMQSAPFFHLVIPIPHSLLASILKGTLRTNASDAAPNPIV
jgi:hypothetical protein